jgi:protein subunit release factor A
LTSLEDDLQKESDQEIKNLYKSEILCVSERLNDLYEEFALSLFDDLSHEECVVEIKPFAGGKDAYLFSSDFLDYLTKVSSNFNWDVSHRISAERVIFC